MFLIILRQSTTFSKPAKDCLCERHEVRKKKQAEFRTDLMSCHLSGFLLIANTATLIKRPATLTQLITDRKRPEYIHYHDGFPVREGFTAWLLVVLYSRGCNLKKIILSERERKSRILSELFGDSLKEKDFGLLSTCCEGWHSRNITSWVTFIKTASLESRLGYGYREKDNST